MQTSPAKPEKIHRYPCIACGADLLYEPKDGFLSCPYCSHKEAIPTSAEQVEERSFEQYLQIRPEQLQSCGATVTFTPPERPTVVFSSIVEVGRNRGTGEEGNG